MAEYLNREAIMKFPIRKDHCDKEHANEHFINGIESVLEYVENLPAVDVAPVRHGRWLDRPKNQGLKDEEIGTVGMVDGEPWSSCYCSECGEWLVASDEYAVKGNYCPNCGAKMDGGED